MAYAFRGQLRPPKIGTEFETRRSRIGWKEAVQAEEADADDAGGKTGGCGRQPDLSADLSQGESWQVDILTEFMRRGRASKTKRRAEHKRVNTEGKQQEKKRQRRRGEVSRLASKRASTDTGPKTLRRPRGGGGAHHITLITSLNRCKMEREGITRGKAGGGHDCSGKEEWIPTS